MPLSLYGNHALVTRAVSSVHLNSLTETVSKLSSEHLAKGVRTKAPICQKENCFFGNISFFSKQGKKIVILLLLQGLL